MLHLTGNFITSEDAAREVSRAAFVCSARGKRGFALLATLSLMVLLVIVALGLISLSSISLRSSGHQQGMAQAKTNARLAMMLAIGDLQKSAGPDQRVTARAEIMDTNPATPVVDGVTQPLWTGVWKTYIPGAGANKPLDSGLRSWSTSQGAQWLVSIPTPATPPDPHTWTGVYPSAVVLAKGLGSTALDVTVPLVNVAGGRYGYWVSDEGVKAKVNLIDPTFNSSNAALSQLHLWNSQALPMQTILPVKTPGTDFRATPSAELGKVTDNASVALLSTIKNPLALNTYSPDITTYSYGVLSDVSHGGLKKDLTAAFEDNTKFNTFADTYGNGARELYSSGTAPNNGGPLWYSLYYHYNTYKSVMPTPPGLAASATNAPTSSINIASPPYTLTPRGYYIKYPDPANPTFLNGPVPVVIAYRVDVAISSYQDGAGKWRFQLQYYPQLVVCNPYSVKLSLTNFALSQGLNAFRFPMLNLTVSGAARPPISINPNATGGRFDLKTAGGELDSLEPGETRVFALDADQNAGSIASACNFTALKSAGNPSVSADHYRYAQLTDSVFAGTMDGDALVHMALSGSDHSAAGDKVRVDYLEQRLYPAQTMWPVLSANGPANGRYATLSGGGTAFASPAVPSAWSDRPISSMVTPYRVLGFFARLKGVAGSNSSTGFIHGAEGVPVFMGNSSVLTPFQHELSIRWKEIFLSPLGSSYLTNSTAINTTPTGETTWGDRSVGDDSSSNLKRYILRDIPSQPLVSLGQFMHMPAYRYSTTSSPKNLNCGSMFTGGSIVPIHIPTDKTALTYTWSPYTTSLLLDDSFLANQALFDQFFLSTVPPANLGSTDNPPDYWTQFNADNSDTRLSDSTTPFLNARIKPYFNGGTAPAMADLRDPENAAANLLLDGAFNINSTSIPAWKALLSSLSGNRLGIWNATGKSMAALDARAATNANPIPRFWSASSTGTPNGPWDGLRVLTDTQVNNLAEQIVTQVKTRGPFLSMADFLNRRLGATSAALTRAGALQAAIDNTSPDINQAAKALGIPVTMSGDLPPVISANLKDAAGNTLNTAVGMPGYLMQQDLVQAFSPVMTARSDTFVIRCYGEAINPATQETTKAWLEAVVQRTPEYIDQSDSKLTAAGNATPAYKSDSSANVGSTNLQFGRSFKIVQFRWLKPNEL